MIGKVTGIARPGGRTVEATLDDAGVWQCQDESVAERLRLFFDPSRGEYAGPSKGQYGYAAVNAAAAYVGGTAELPKAEGEPGVIY